MALTGRIGKLEDKAMVTGAVKGAVAGWALEFVREGKARLMEGRTGEIMRELVGENDAAMEEIRTMREAKHLSDLYPDLEACKRGEARRANKIHALLAPRFVGATQ